MAGEKLNSAKQPDCAAAVNDNQAALRGGGGVDGPGAAASQAVAETPGKIGACAPVDAKSVADIVGIGSPVIDLLVNVPYIPIEEGAMRANEIFHQGGGNCASAIATAARLGAKAGIIGKVGGDATGDFIIKDFKYNGVDTSRIIRGAPDTSSTYCVAISETDKGTRKFLARASTVGRLSPDEIAYDYIKTAKILHIETSGDEASLAGAKFAKEHGITVTIDAGYYSKQSETVLPYVDVFISSEFFYKGMFPDDNGPDSYRRNFEKIMEMGPSVVWVTLGERGCVGLVDGEMHAIPSFKVPVKDTTGAGDDFHGAYIAIMLEGLSHYECARHASAVSAIKCTFVGGRTGLPDRAMLKRFLDEGILPTKELEERLLYYRRTFLDF
ncbi:MAG: carbohydrate kinase family protein [Oscillospiraceae bacterium]|nr:carbohydrate kinase family protein [Oscillospiraceae bacterium]